MVPEPRTADRILDNALVALGEGDYHTAFDCAEGLVAEALVCPLWALPIVVEAASRVGSADRAHVALARLRAHTSVDGTRMAFGVLARSEAIVAPGPEAECRYRLALDLLETSERPLERARTDLLYGEWLRRQRRRRDARRFLANASEVFAALGAEAFRARAERELMATGGQILSSADGDPDALTPQEHSVARLAASGATNREVAARLFVGTATVDHHLGRVYRKLGVRSRRELAGHIEGGPWASIAAAGAAPAATMLTRQERAVAELAASGATNAEIAGRLCISPSTVDYHLGKVYRRLGLRSRRDLRRVLR